MTCRIFVGSMVGSPVGSQIVGLATGAGAQNGFFFVFSKFWYTKHPQDKNDKTGQELLSRRTSSCRRLGMSKARPTLHHQILKYNYRTTEGNAQDSQGLPVSFLGSSLGVERTDMGRDFGSPILVTDFSLLNFPLFLRDVPGPCSSDSLQKKWETLAVLSIAICELFWLPCPELD